MNPTLFSSRHALQCLPVVTLALLLFSLSAEATAPRIAAQMFGEERKADIVAYQLVQGTTAESTSGAMLVIVKDACKAGGKQVSVDVVPSRQLAQYAVSNGEVAALIGVDADLAAKDKAQYRSVVFFISGNTTAALHINKKHAAGNELYQACSNGLQKIIGSGRYEEILNAHLNAEEVPSILEHIKSLNAGKK